MASEWPIATHAIAVFAGMVAAVTIADDPVLVLGCACPPLLGTSNDWALFPAALGCGTALGSLAPRKLAGLTDLSSRSRRAALWLLALSGCIFTYVIGISPLVSLIAAGGAGVAGMYDRRGDAATGRPANCCQHPSVMALWAIAWAGTKPIASLLDGWLATVLSVRLAGIILIMPALPGRLEVQPPPAVKERLERIWATLGSEPLDTDALS